LIKKNKRLIAAKQLSRVDSDGILFALKKIDPSYQTKTTSNYCRLKQTIIGRGSIHYAFF